MTDLLNVPTEYIQEHIAPMLFSGKSILPDKAMRYKEDDLWQTYVLYKEEDGKVSRELVSEDASIHLCFLFNGKALCVAAMENLKRMSDYQITPVFEMLSRSVPGFNPDMEEGKVVTPPDDEPPMYILHGKSGYSVAALILDHEVQKQISDLPEMKDGYYIIPSSIHEVIIVPKGTCKSVSFLNSIVRFVNADCVSPEERLGDHVYEIRDGSLCTAEIEKPSPKKEKKTYEITVSDSTTYRVRAANREDAEEYAMEMFSERTPSCTTIVSSDPDFEVEIL